MVPKEFLLIAGDVDNDRLAAALVTALRQELTTAEAGYSEDVQPLHASLDPRFYGAGGRHMANTGVDLVFETKALQAAQSRRLTHLLVFRRVFKGLHQLALDREPHAIVGVGFYGFNLRFARAVKHYVRHRQGTFYNWDPLLIQLGAPPGWLLRASRSQQVGQDIDLLLSTDPSEKARYAEHAPNLRVEFVGRTDGPSSDLETAHRAARGIVGVLMDSEAHFPLRAYLSAA